MDERINEFKHSVQDTLQKSQDDFEKQLSFIGAGALGLSMLLIDKVVKNFANADNKWILIGSWIFLGLTLIINLLSHLIGAHFYYKNINEIQEERYDQLASVKRNSIITRLNITTVVTLIIGLIFLITFISTNV